jgi:hypothetical protein
MSNNHLISEFEILPADYWPFGGCCGAVGDPDHHGVEVFLGAGLPRGKGIATGVTCAGMRSVGRAVGTQEVRLRHDRPYQVSTGDDWKTKGWMQWAVEFGLTSQSKAEAWRSDVGLCRQAIDSMDDYWSASIYVGVLSTQGGAVARFFWLLISTSYR